MDGRYLFGTDPTVNAVYRNFNNGSPEVFASGGLLIEPTGITVSDNNELIIANTAGLNLIAIDSSATQTELVSGFPVNPRGLVNAGNGNYFVRYY